MELVGDRYLGGVMRGRWARGTTGDTGDMRGTGRGTGGAGGSWKRGAREGAGVEHGDTEGTAGFAGDTWDWSGRRGAGRAGEPRALRVGDGPWGQGEGRGGLVGQEAQGCRHPPPPSLPGWKDMATTSCRRAPSTGARCGTGCSTGRASCCSPQAAATERSGTAVWPRRYGRGGFTLRGLRWQRPRRQGGLEVKHVDFRAKPVFDPSGWGEAAGGRAPQAGFPTKAERSRAGPAAALPVQPGLGVPSIHHVY